MSILNLMRETNNFFERSCEANAFTIANGQLTLSEDYLKGMYIGIKGSFFNDGVYIVGDNHIVSELQDEIFTGTIYKLAPPKDFILLSTEIDEYIVKTPISDVTSESFGNYSYSKAQGNKGNITWQELYASRLNSYRKMFTNVWI